MMDMCVFDQKKSDLKSKVILSPLWLSRKIMWIYSEIRHSCLSDTS